MAVSKILNDGLRQRLLIVLDRPNIISALSDDFLDDLRLAAQGVHSHHAALEYPRIQQRLDRRKFVALARRAFLSQQYAQRVGIGTDPVSCRIRSVLRAPHGLAIKCHYSSRNANDAGHPLTKASLEYLGVQNTKYFAKRVRRGRPLFQDKECLQPVFLAFAPVRDIDPSVRTAPRKLP